MDENKFFSSPALPPLARTIRRRLRREFPLEEPSRLGDIVGLALGLAAVSVDHGFHRGSDLRLEHARTHVIRQRILPQRRLPDTHNYSSPQTTDEKDNEQTC